MHAMHAFSIAKFHPMDFGYCGKTKKEHIYVDKYMPPPRLFVLFPTFCGGGGGGAFLKSFWAKHVRCHGPNQTT